WNLVFPFSEGFEVLAEQEIQPVPWAEHWVRGMTNIRGEIHTVVDFSDFLGFGAVPSLRTAILFRLPDENLKSVLLLERWVNLRTFPEGLEQTEDAGIPPPLSSLVSSVLVERKQTWVVLDVDRLCRMPEFISIARRAAGH
ncbi:MAG: chemotaxis protein CheW, partial [Gammaproteobacteria bacterium]|nr:chemotaxis protein CheW [Gammaproteobacteria bacterium]